MSAWLAYFAANSPILTLLTFAFYVLAVVCAVREVMVSRTSQGSIAWLLSLALLPFPTVMIYLVVGWKHFDDYGLTQTRILRTARADRSRTMPLIDDASSKAWPVLSSVANLPFLAAMRRSTRFSRASITPKPICWCSSTSCATTRWGSGWRKS
jgi:cardiolipin synthase